MRGPDLPRDASYIGSPLPCLFLIRSHVAQAGPDPLLIVAKDSPKRLILLPSPAGITGPHHKPPCWVSV